MARDNLAYRQEAFEQSYDAQPIPLPRPQLRTIEGQGRREKARQESLTRTLVTMGVVILALMATASVVRVSLSNATVQVMQTAEQTSTAIEQARAVGLELEVEHSLANNPTRIQDNAAALGILPVGQMETLQALSGFSAETISEMQRAAAEYKAVQLAMLQEAEQSSAATNPATSDDDVEQANEEESSAEDETQLSS